MKWDTRSQIIAHMETQKVVFEKNNIFGVSCFFGG